MAPGALHGRKQLKGAYAIDLHRIRPDPAQPRKQFEDESVKSLANSIRKHGVIQPISVRYVIEDDIYQIISGEQRFRAVKSLALDTIPCVIHDPDERHILVRQVVENWQRRQLHPFEIADALAQLRDASGYSQKQLADETGKPEGEISKFLKLLELAPAIQKESRGDATGMLTARHLYNVARLEPEEQEATIAAIREHRLSAIDTEHLVKQKIDRRTHGPKRGAPVTKVEYFTSKAKVTLVFRKQTIEKGEILAALDEARAKAKAAAKPVKLNIVRPK